MDSAKLLADLTDQEGFRPVLYDDANGRRITKGSIVAGNPTLGVGWNVAGRPCSQELAGIICTYQIEKETWPELLAALPWLATAPEPVQRALCNLSFNLGVPDLMTFIQFLALVQLGNYSQAADDLGTTLWARQVGSRAGKIQALLRIETEGA